MKNRNFVNLNINPCKMCMPMGAVTAFKGIENSMMILHGSQGCSTYIRRHMSGHYNEPIDVASTSLSEEGTIYGGEKNLKAGLKNMIALYGPKVIGVATTCLAETIGEDIGRIIDAFEVLEDCSDVQIVPVSTPGYGGTQFEGYFAALYAIVKKLATDKTPNPKVNVITSPLTPGEIREIKRMLELFELDVILLPDISDTLDAPFKKEYRKMPTGGTKEADIRQMAGAMATIEIGLTVPERLSPGQYLLEEHQVPLYKVPVPMGMGNSDYFMSVLSKLSGREIPASLSLERGRMLDGMIDSHKYNAEGRAVIFGEPEQVYAVSRLCLENGIKPVLVSTGAQSELLKKLLSEEKDAEGCVVIEDADFETIQKHARALKANILIGSSDGKVITEQEGIPLVRYGFPIHDRVGGQRAVAVGYTGSLNFLDTITNTLLENKYAAYRQNMVAQHYVPVSAGKAPVLLSPTQPLAMNAMDEKTASHPCYNGCAGNNARMHIPVAPGCNISCNYCNRKFDCQNESRPGVTSEVLSPEEALAKFKHVKGAMDNLKVVGIAGPGDALANFENTQKSIELIKKADKDIIFCLSTNGLMLPHYAKEILALGVNHITVTINAIDPDIGAKIYKEIHYQGRTITGVDAATILIVNQLKGLKVLVENGAIVKVNIVMIKGINDHHIETVVKKVKSLGAYMTNIMPLIPAEGSVFEKMPLTNNKELNALRKKCEVDLKQMYHCKQCRADAIGTLDNDQAAQFRKKCSSRVKDETKALNEVYQFAIASNSGLSVDAHFGRADAFYIYEYANNEIVFKAKRKVWDRHSEGHESESAKIKALVDSVSDCDGLLVLRIGEGPMQALKKRGVHVVQTCEGIFEAVEQAVEALEGKNLRS